MEIESQIARHIEKYWLNSNNCCLVITYKLLDNQGKTTSEKTKNLIKWNVIQSHWIVKHQLQIPNVTS